MNKLTTSFLVLALSSLGWSFGFSDVQFWVGSGSNQAALAVQWNDGQTPQALVWGYRWDGTANTETMLQAIDSADARLFKYAGTPGQFGLPLYGIGYDTNSSGVTGAGFTNSTSVPDNATANDPTDRWKVGWTSLGFWELYEGANGTTAGGWAGAQTGVTGSTIANNDWRALSFAPGFSSQGVGTLTAAPVPEPATLLFVGLGLAALAKRRRA
ncbi:MAG: PEP-CTERM sorting domain-containing protein [Armatimonadetes bacterium]|nr:PEP-CTERM sorting domain-containing protein [Armatimonadota bacterium]